MPYLPSMNPLLAEKCLDEFLALFGIYRLSVAYDLNGKGSHGIPDKRDQILWKVSCKAGRCHGKKSISSSYPVHHSLGKGR